MLDKTITSALLNLRAQIIRDKLEGLEHVNALLVARGVDPAAHIVRAKRKGDAARRGIMRMMVLNAMRDGPKRYTEIAAIAGLRRPDIALDSMQRRTAQVLVKLQIAGAVTREGRLWGLASHQKNTTLWKTAT